MALIDKITDIRNFDYKKVRKTNTTENGTFKTNQRNNSEKNTSFDEGRVQQQYTKLSPDEDQFLKKEPGDRYRGTKLDDGLYRGGAALNVERNVEDVERIGKFLTTPKGLLFTGKQVILQKQNASEHTKGYKIISPITNRPPFTRDERHKAGGLFSSPFSEAPKYEDKDILKKNAGKIGHMNTPSYDYNAVNQVVLAGPNSKTPSKRMSVRTSPKEAVRSILNIPYMSRSDYDKLQIPKDFIDFKIYDPINKTYIVFPAYLTDITDNSSAEYNPTRYIGRPDQVFVYSGYTRNISFGFRVCALTKDDMPILWQKVDKIKALTLPTFSKQVIQNDDELRPIAPFVQLTIGNLFRNQPGYFGSVNVTIPQTTTWETEDGHQLPHLCDISVEFTYVGKKLPSTNFTNQYDRGTRNSDGTDLDLSKIKSGNRKLELPKLIKTDLTTADTVDVPRHYEIIGGSAAIGQEPIQGSGVVGGRGPTSRFNY
jgi:hypothetical protein